MAAGVIGPVGFTFPGRGSQTDHSGAQTLSTQQNHVEGLLPPGTGPTPSLLGGSVISSEPLAMLILLAWNLHSENRWPLPPRPPLLPPGTPGTTFAW